ncbi:AI-2E family transporter [Microbacterium mitrae]|uniref:AI-2E family transporter n=1 Tax=Microbacterium mitrae TaxID=664640 RepID=A0A5C8HM32_9MICO|nr:AI-2E family transporter [Microbacterium mitrae]TXK04516.1 AI-2E family transporter [Microbacterium mitrae]
MGFFRRHNQPPAPVPVTLTDPPRPSFWADSFGKLATRSLQVIIVIALTAGVIIAMRVLNVVVIPVILALIFASAFAPVMRWLRARGFSSLWATIIAMLGSVVVLGGVVWLIVWQVRTQWPMLAEKAAAGWALLVDWATHLELPFVIDQDQIDQWLSQVGDFLTSAQFGSGALAGVGAVASFFTGLVLLIVVLFYFLRDGRAIWEFLLRPFRGTHEQRARRVGTKTVETLGSYVRGTAAVAAVDAIGIGICLFILQVPLALPLAVLVFLLAFIPLVGATVAGILAALVALVANGPFIALVVVAVVIGVNQIEGNFLQPVLMGRSLKLHSLVILIALAVGTLLGGVLGAVLAVPIAAVAWGIIQVWDGPNTPAVWARKHVTAPAPQE